MPTVCRIPAAHGPNWEARKKQAANLFEKSRESNAN
jgi:hypothetical protein